MKKLLLTLPLLLLVIICSCTRDYGILDYQSKDIVAECKINGKYKTEITKTANLCKIRVTEPTTAQGIEFEITEDKACVSYGELKIELDKEKLKGVCAIASMFSQSEEYLTGAWDEKGKSILTFEQNGTHFQITLGESSTPKRVKILNEDFEYDIEICTIKLT